MPCGGFSLRALSPHHVSSCFILLGSLCTSASICLKNSEGSTSLCGIADCPFSIRELALRPRIVMLLLRAPPAIAPPFLRNSLLRLLIGVSLKGSAIFVAFGSFSSGVSTVTGVAWTSSSCSAGAGCFLRDSLPLVLLAPSCFAAAIPFVRLAGTGAWFCSSSTTSSIEPRVRRVGRFLGKASASSCTIGEELRPLRVGRFDVVADASNSSSVCSCFGGGGGDARFFAFAGLPLDFFTVDFGAGSGSGAGGGRSLADAVFCRFARVNIKSPSCSSYSACAARS